MANTIKFAVKNGLLTQNIDFLSPNGSNTIQFTMLDNDTLSISGNSGQLFSISDSLTGTIFSVNDISGIPSIEVDDTGQIRLAQYSGNILIGTATDNGTDKLQVNGSSTITDTIKSTKNIGTGLSTYNTAKTVIGNIHLTPGAGTLGTNQYQAAITFQGDVATEAQAGIYVLNTNTAGTSLAIATTNSYATGPQVGLSISPTGVVNFPRARPTYAGNTILDAGNYGTYALPLTGGTVSGLVNVTSPTNTLGRRLELGYTPDVNAYIKTTATSTANSQNLIIKTDSSSWEQLTIRANGSNEIQGNTTFYGSVVFNQTPLTAGGENLSIVANTITGYPLMALTPFNSGTLILEGNPNPSDGTFPLGLVDVPSTFRVADRIISTLATGTAPFTIASTTLNTNLNADLLDGQHGTYYQQALVSGTNIKTINGSSVLGPGNLSVSGGISYTKKTSAYTAVDRDGILADTSGGAFTINLPASATVGMQVWIADDGSWATNNLTVDPNGGTIEGLAVDENLVLDLSGVQVQFIHNGAKWQIYVTYGSTDGGFVTLTGAQILTNKTLTSPVINTPIIKETVSVISGNTTAVASTFYVLTASLTLTLPSGPSAGDWVGIQNSSGVDTCVIARNGSNIMSLAENMTFDNTTVGIRLTYADATRGWVLT